MGNQNDDNLTLIQWQVVKGVAEYYNVTDWTSKVDTSLGLSENIDLMKENATDITATGGKTMKDIAAREKAKTQWGNSD